MLEMLYGFTGIVFAWVVMGFFWFPVLCLVEFGGVSYVKYATAGKIEPKRRFNILFDKMFAKFEGVEGFYIIPLIIYWGWGLINWNFNDRGFNPSTEAAIDAFFGVYVPIGAWLAPALLLIAVVFAPTWLSRKVFTMADAFTKHVGDKDAHKEK